MSILRLGVFTLNTTTYGDKKKTNHFKRNRGKYLAGSICLLVGGLIGVYVSKTKKSSAVIESILPSPELEVVKTVFDSDIINHIGRNGHPGNVIYCNETKQIFRSHREATRELGINPRDLWAYLKGIKTNARGYTFKKLGEANKALFEEEAVV